MYSFLCVSATFQRISASFAPLRHNYVFHGTLSVGRALCPQYVMGKNCFHSQHSLHCAKVATMSWSQLAQMPEYEKDLQHGPFLASSRSKLLFRGTLVVTQSQRFESKVRYKFPLEASNLIQLVIS